MSFPYSNHIYARSDIHICIRSQSNAIMHMISHKSVQKHVRRIIGYDYCYYYSHYHGNEQNSLLNDLRILITINHVTLSVFAVQHLIHICIIRMFSGRCRGKERSQRYSLIIPRYAINIVINAKFVEALRLQPLQLKFHNGKIS